MLDIIRLMIIQVDIDLINGVGLSYNLIKKKLF